MTKYYKQLNENGELVLLLTYDFEPVITDPLIVEIGAEEYEQLLAEIVAKNKQPESDEATMHDLYNALAELGVTDDEEINA